LPPWKWRRTFARGVKIDQVLFISLTKRRQKFPETPNPKLRLCGAMAISSSKHFPKRYGAVRRPAAAIRFRPWPPPSQAHADTTGAVPIHSVQDVLAIQKPVLPGP